MMDIASARTTILREKLALVRGHRHHGRATAFRARALREDQAQLAFRDIAALPDWLLALPDAQARLPKIVALLFHRPAIDHELSGSKLAALSDAVGEALFDRICEVQLPDTVACSAIFPRPEDLDSIGRDLMNRAIPEAFAARFSGAVGDQNAAIFCALAAQILADAGHEE
jgi:hypothetical protein